MIQRIQTVYLLLATAFMAVVFLLPKIYLHHFPAHWRNLILIAWGIAAFLSFAAIFPFKKRKLQVKISILALFFLVCSYVILFWQVFMIPVDFSLLNPYLAFPLLAFILIVLAIQAIRKDEKLIRSTYRLR